MIDRLELWLVCIAGAAAYLIAVATFTLVAPDWPLSAAFWRSRRQVARLHNGTPTRHPDETEADYKARLIQHMEPD